jgi:hypothetical protein
MEFENHLEKIFELQIEKCHYEFSTNKLYASIGIYTKEITSINPLIM